MLPRAARLHRSSDFSEVVRHGRRAGRRTLTVHLLLDPAEPAPAERPARAGLVVSKAVGGSVVRSAVSRRLRHQLVERLDVLPPGARMVVRAAPAASTARSSELGADLDAALQRLRVSPGRRP